MQVIVTRLLAQAQRWVELLQRQGHDGLALPLIEVCPLADTSKLLAARHSLADYAAVMFVSSAAADGFFAAMPASDAPSVVAAMPRAWCTGPGTRAALLRHGMTPEQVDAPAHDAPQFDSETLWQQVASQVQPGCRILIVRGDTVQDSQTPDREASQPSSTGVGRDWLAQRLHHSGAAVDFVVAYQRRVPVWSERQHQQALSAASNGAVWLFSSAEAVGNLKRLMPGQDWSQARAIATHARIAAAVRTLGFARVAESQPSLPAVLASLESIK